MISCANDVVTNLTTKLSHESIERTIVLKMNKKFIEYMWREHKREFQRYMEHGASFFFGGPDEAPVIVL